MRIDQYTSKGGSVLIMYTNKYENATALYLKFSAIVTEYVSIIRLQS
ncbi:hypothetical protein J2S08_004463 [Bacillus chungangensis]|uniref:Uncharacterized protein n=1 Tax=Bacillus chungangensis TaxID=587633 RepID=A0ABT9WZ28_9BACI|nr:hypothetical protein [Bacillus chungangensis]